MCCLQMAEHENGAHIEYIQPYANLQHVYLKICPVGSICYTHSILLIWIIKAFYLRLINVNLTQPSLVLAQLIDGPVVGFELLWLMFTPQMNRSRVNSKLQDHLLQMLLLWL